MKPSYYILGNLEMCGFYRVNYDESNWDKIIKQLKHDKDVSFFLYIDLALVMYNTIRLKAINVINRAQLVNDIFGFAENGMIEITKPFELISYLVQETEYLPWMVAIERIKYISDMLESSDAYKSLQDYLIRLIKPIYNRVSWKERKEDAVKDR